MKKIFAIFRRDVRSVRGNAIALLVIMGLIIMPSFYAWFNIAGGWDPYGNSGNIKVALANSDEGVRGSIVPFQVNVGERVVTSLSGSSKIGYVVTTEEEAVEGVRSGKYYAAVVIPKNFSTNLLSVLTVNPTHPRLEYYVNEKVNAIASIVTGKASGSVQNMVNEGFTEAVTQVATDIFDEFTSLADSDGVTSLASGLSDSLGDTLSALERSSSDLLAYKNVVASIRDVMNSSGSVMGTGSTSLSVASSLNEAADGVRALDSVASRAKSAANSAIDSGKQSMEDVKSQIDEAFAVAGDKTDQLVSALSQINERAAVHRDNLNVFLENLRELNDRVATFERSFSVGDINVEYVHSAQIDISDLINRTEIAVSYLNELIGTMNTTIADIQTTQSNAVANREQLQDLAQRAQDGINAARDGYDDKLSGSLEDIAGVIDKSAQKATSISEALQTESEKLSSAITGASDDLKKLEDALDAASAKLGEVSNKLDGLSKKLADALSSGDMDLVRTIMGSDAASLVSFLASPVQLDREAYFPVQNNGSAMTPFYTTMALWVGGTLIGLLIYVGISKKTEEELQTSPHHAYFGRLAFVLCIGACQSTVLMLGDLFFLRVQCQNPVLFLLTGWLASTVFLNIIYSLATSFGDVGKAIAVFIMVLQVAGSGGTFPVEMLPAPFQAAYPFLPFVHSENAFRAAMFGTYGNDWLMEMGTLALFLVPALLLGLVLRKPLIPVNEWIEEKMEETKLM